MTTFDAIDTRHPSRQNLTPVLCALCHHPVAHMTRVSAAMAGGLCTRESCTRDPKRPDVKRQVYTFNRMLDVL